MPEGPQAHRAGNLIGRHIGASILKITHPKSRKPWPIKLPVTIASVKVKGKNIFIHLSNELVIYNHMLMWGSWRSTCQTAGKKRLNTCFQTTHGQLGYFGGGILKLVNAQDAAQIWSKLGPELVASSDWQTAFSLVVLSNLPVGEALLNQELVSGIGNIYKSEGLFAARIHPTRLANQISGEQFQRLFNFLKPQMLQDETKSGPITTTTLAAQKAGTRNFVYRRYHQSCLFCGTKIERLYQGQKPGRSTYFCPRCQPISSALPRL